MKLPELEDSVRSGRLVPDGKVCLNSSGELAVTKFAVEPVWYLPGVAERFGVDEGTLRRALFEYTGGMYPEVLTCPKMMHRCCGVPLTRRPFSSSPAGISTFSCRLLVIALCGLAVLYSVASRAWSDNILGGLTVYVFGDPANMSDPSKRLALRIHDEVGQHHRPVDLGRHIARVLLMLF